MQLTPWTFPYRAAAVLFLVLAAAMVLSLSLTKELDHDEHQFVASGVLLARSGLLPYQDYPYFHMPNLVFVHAALARITRYPLLATRLFSATCGVLTIGLIYAWAWRIFADRPLAVRLGLSTAGATLLLTNWLFIKTTGLAWNHDTSTLLVLLAFMAVSLGWQRRSSAVCMAAAGLAAGLAVGTRLTHLPVILLLAGMILAFPHPAPRGRLLGLLLFCGAVLAGLLPSLAMFILAPRQFIFGNFGYPLLHTVWAASTGSMQARAVHVKFVYAVGRCLLKPGNAILIGMLVATLLARKNAGPVDHPHDHERKLSGLMALYLLIGSFAPTPAYPVYFYAPMPFILLWLMYTLASLLRADVMPRALRRGLATAWVVAVALGIGHYASLAKLFRPSSWEPMIAHRAGERLRGITGPGRILTIAPICALEGGLDIYPEYATGPFAARVAPLMPRAQRQAVGVLSYDDLPAHLALVPPVALLKSADKELDDDLVVLARQAGYRVVWLTDLYRFADPPREQRRK